MLNIKQKRKNNIFAATLAIVLCLCIGLGVSFSSARVKSYAVGVPTMDFGWDTGLSSKLDASGSSYNAKRGQTYGSDTILSNADGGVTNAALVGNGNIGGVFGGASAGQSLNIGANEFWKGEYDHETMEGLGPQTVGSIGYNVVDENNKANSDIDLATTYKNVSASSEEEGFPASAAVTGDYVSNAFWGMGWWSRNGEGNGSWLQLEFEEAITFKRFAIWNDGSCRLDAGYDVETGKEDWNTNAFTLEVSNDGTTWTKAKIERCNYLPIYDRDLDKAYSGKFVRLSIQKAVIKGTATARICKFSLFANAKNPVIGGVSQKNLMPELVNDKKASISVTSNCTPDSGQDAAHIYTASNLYATACDTQQHLAGYGSWGYGWYTKSDPSDWTEAITYKFNEPTSFKSYQLWNASASTVNAYNRGDWRGWKVETSTDGVTWKEVHKLNNPTSSDSLVWAGQPAVNSFDLASDKIADASDISYIKLTMGSAFNGRGLLSQFKIFPGSLADAGIMTNNQATFTQNIKEGKVGVDAIYNGQTYTSRTSMSQSSSNSQNYVVTELKNTSNAPITMRYYTSAHHYRNPDYCQTAGKVGNRTIYSTRTTPTAAPENLAWVASATIAASIEGGKDWANIGVTKGSAYGDITIAPGATERIIAYVDCAQFTDKMTDYDKITAINTPTKQTAIDKSVAGDGAQIIADSTNWWKEFWLKSFVDVYDSTIEKFYYNALYIVGGSSREDNVPTSLFGPYKASDNTAWGGTYVADYNLYGTYMAVASSNRADLLKPLVRNALESWGGVEEIGGGIGKEYAKRFNEATAQNFRNSDGSLMFKNGVDGVLAAVVSAPHGYACSVSGFYGIMFTNAYAAIPVLSYFDMTQGKGEIDGVKITKELEYNYLKDIMSLYEQVLIYENGVYKIKYDGAWEAEPNNMGNAFSIASIHMFTKRLIADAADLGITEEIEPRLLKWAHIDAHMEPYPTAMVTDKFNPNNPIVRKCFSDTLTTAQQNHVTYNGNYGKDGRDSNPNVVVAQVIPTDELGLYSDPEQKALMRNSLANIKSWNNINAMPTIFSTAARVGYKSDKYGNKNIANETFDGGVNSLTEQLSKVAAGGLKQNTVSGLVDPLQLIDTCGGAQGLNDILVQTFKGITTLFPSYDENKSGRFVNLQSKGGFLVSAAQNNQGKVTYAKVESKFGGKFTYALPNGANWSIIDEKGATISTTHSTVGKIVGYSDYNNIRTIAFDTTAGKSYYVIDNSNSKSVNVSNSAKEIAYISGKED